MQDFKYWYQRATISLKKSDFKTAVIQLKKALNYDPTQHMGWSLLSAVFRQLKDYNNALEANLNIMKYDLEIENINDIERKLFENLPQKDNLINSFKNAFEEGEQFRGNWVFVANYYSGIKDYKKAIDAIKYAIKIYVQNPSLRLNLCRYYKELGEYEKAIKTIYELLELLPDFQFAKLYLAEVYLEKGDLKAADKIIEEVLSLDPLFEPAVVLKQKILEKDGSIEGKIVFELYQGQRLYKNQKDFLIDLEKAIGEPIKPLIFIDIKEIFGYNGFISKGGYITGLGISMKALSKLPESIGNLKHLKTLYISSCLALKELPQNLIHLKELEEFRFSGCLIGNFALPFHSQQNPQEYPLDEKIGKLISLKRLDIRDNIGITTLPKCLEDLSYLQEIDITNCHSLTNIPEGIKDKVIGETFAHIIEQSKKLQKLPIVEEILPKKDGVPDEEIYHGDKKVIEDLELMTSSSFTKVYDTQSYRSNCFTVKNSRINNVSILQYTTSINLPESLVNLEYLSTLRIMNGLKLRALPNDFYRLKSLKHLKISNCNSLNNLSEKFGLLPSLETFTISRCNNLESLPDNFYDLKKFNHLEIYDCDSLTNLSHKFGLLPSLEELVIMGCHKLTSLPNSFYHLESLKNFKIQRCNNLKDISENFGLLPSLEALSITGCSSLISLPNSFYQLKNLKNLAIYACGNFENLSEQFGLLPSLEILTISGCNNLISLPNSFYHLGSLKNLVIHACSRLNNLSEKFGSLPSLEALDIAGCHKLRSLPDSFYHLKPLKNLNIQDCDGFDNLSEDFGLLSSLEDLSIKGCINLLSLPNSFYHLERLKKLVIHDCSNLNNLSEQFGLLPSLKTLIISGCNNLKSLPNSFGELKKLKTLSIINCALEYLPNSFRRLSLKDLEISDCKLTDFPYEILFSKNLKSIKLLQYDLNFNQLFHDIKSNALDELTSLNYIKLIIETSTRRVHNEMKVFSVPINEKSHIKALDTLLWLLDENIEKTTNKKKYMEILNICLFESYNSKVKATALKGMFKYFLSDYINTIKELADKEYSGEVLKTLLDLLKSHNDLKYLRNLILNRLSTIFLTIPEESEALLDISLLNNPGYYGTRLDDKYFKIYGTDSIKQFFSDYSREYSQRFYLLEDGNVIGIKLTRRGIEQLPISLASLNYLRYIDISSNRLRNLPDWIELFSELEMIDLSDNLFSEIPRFLTEMKSLKKIKVNDNPHLTEFPIALLNPSIEFHIEQGVSPDEAKILAHLEQTIGIELIKIDYYIPKGESSRYYTLNNEGNVSGLYINDFDLFSLTEIPKPIFSLSKLEELDLSNSDFIQEIPKEIVKLKKLTYLNLSNNEINTIPEELSDLFQIEKLDLHGNKIDVIPNNIAKLKTLKYLDLGSNNIDIIPKELELLGNLNYLGLYDNKLKQIPEIFLNLRNLKEFYLSFNQLSDLPKTIKNSENLEILSISGNDLTEIPTSVTNISSLKELYLAGNKIESIPNSIKNLKNLSRLDLSDNKIKEIPEALEDIDSLNYLDLSYNEIENHPFIENKIKNFILKKKPQKTDYDDI